MAPLSGFSGLAPALWCTLRGYTKDEHRAVLQNFNLLVLAATMASLVSSGRARAEHLPQMGVVAASLLVPSIWGSKIYIGMSPTPSGTACCGCWCSPGSPCWPPRCGT